MKIVINIEDNDGEQIFHAENLAVESAMRELHRFETHVLPTLPDSVLDSPF